MTRPKVASPWFRYVSMASLALSIAGFAWFLRAQDTAPAGYVPYALRDAQATEISPALQQVLAALNAPFELAVDRGGNRLLVKGSDQVQQVARQTVAALDRPAAATAAAAPRTAEPSVVRGYAAAGRPLEETIEDLRAKFPPATGTRIAPDSRTQQVIVVAPETVHQAVAALLPPAGNQPTVAAPASPAGPAATAATAAGGYRLTNISWRELEDRLAQAWEGRLSRATDRGGEVAVFQLATSTGGQPVLQVDRRHDVVTFLGSPPTSRLWERVIRELDRPAAISDQQTELVPIDRADPSRIQQAVSMVQLVSQQSAPQQAAASGEPAGAGEQAAPANGGQGAGQGDVTAVITEDGGLIGPVQIEYIEGLDVIVLRGNQRDVDRVRRIIADIERLSTETQPTIEIHQLTHVASQAIADLVTSIYNEILSPRQGQVTIRPLVKPNALLMIGRPESVAIVKDLIDKLDQPVEPETQFEVFPLKHISALDALEVVQNFFVDRLSSAQQGVQAQQALRPGLGTRLNVVGDYRTNSLIVQAGPRDLEEVRRMLSRLDVESVASEKEVRIFRLKNALSTDVAPVLQDAINWQVTGSRVPLGATRTGTFGGQGFGQAEETARLRSAILTFMTVDSEGHKVLESGILADVRVTADTNGNALIITGPSKSMGLIEALIKELDTLPSARAQIKVFSIVNGDATSLASMLQQLLAQQAQTTQAFGGFGQGTINPFLQPGLQSAAAAGEGTLVPIRFGVDARTNSIIVTGSEGDVGVVEAVLLRLDEGSLEKRRTTVYWLANAPATNVATAVNAWLTEREALFDEQIGLSPEAPLLQVGRDVIVVAEAVSNSVIVSATPEWFDEVMHVVEALDRRLPLIKIDVLIAEIQLTDFFELGVEWGLQDSLLFDRTYDGAGAGQPTRPGFNFNNEPLGDIGGNRGNVLGQALSSFGMLRASSALGYGGLVLSASRDSVSMLIRALQEDGRAQILSRPQITTLDSQPGSVFVGTLTARPGEIVTNVNGNVASINDTQVGLLLGVTPRVTPDGLVIMELDITRSRLSDDFTVINDDVIQNINSLETSATISARSGQTVVTTGLIETNKFTEIRGIPFLSQLPILGPLFSFKRDNDIRSELLVILTPHVIQCDEEIDWFTYSESERMSWCLADVMELHGEINITSRPTPWCACEAHNAPVIFPDLNPTGVCETGGYEEFTPAGDPSTDHGLMLPTPADPDGRHLPQVDSGSGYRLPPPVSGPRADPGSRLRIPSDPTDRWLPQADPPGGNPLPPHSSSSWQGSPDQSLPAGSGYATQAVGYQGAFLPSPAMLPGPPDAAAAGQQLLYGGALPAASGAIPTSTAAPDRALSTADWIQEARVPAAATRRLPLAR